MLPETHLIEDLCAADRECTRILDDMLFGIQAIEQAPIASSDAEGDLRGYSRMCRVFTMVYRVQFHAQRAIGAARADTQIKGGSGTEHA